VRAIAVSAYRRGARFVDVSWFDPWVKRARVEHAPDDTLDFVPSWYGERVLALGSRARGADRADGSRRPGTPR
jgi:aminopeptidase